MSTPLNRAIEALSTPGTSGADALRSLLVVARRVGGDDLAQWLRHELDGYPEGSQLPRYRILEGLPITLTWHGFFGSSATTKVSDHEIPEEIRPGKRHLRQPVAELEALAALETDPSAQLPSSWVMLYRDYFAKGEAPGWEDMVVNYAAQLYPRTVLRGILDQVKTSALDLALELEQVAPHVGDPGGPTTETVPELGREITLRMTQIYGSGATVIVGDDASVATGGSIAIRLDAGDVDGLLAAARTYLTQDGVEDLQRALDGDGGNPGENTTSFLSKVKAGGVALAAGVATNGAYDGLLGLLGQVFPGFGS